MNDDPSPPSELREPEHGIETPPTTIPGILSRLGPGLIIAGSIVGSGELIATTATGAQAGFTLLWLILIGCVIKVFVQVELGRHSLISGRRTMAAMNDVPGPRFAVRGVGANWLVSYWILVFLVSIGQLGGIVGGVGQALAISAPLTEAGRRYNEQMEVETQYTVAVKELEQIRRQADEEGGGRRAAQLEGRAQQLGAQYVRLRLEAAAERLERDSRRADNGGVDQQQVRLLQEVLAVVKSRIASFGEAPEEVFKPEGEDIAEKSKEFRDTVRGFGRRTAQDHQIWAAAVALATAIMLVLGRYGFIQSISAILVASFTFITIINVLALQNNSTYAASWSDILHGMSFRLAQQNGAAELSALATALAAFGIIGVGGNELVAYPYWCLEKGYARFTGPRNNSAEWAERARGWLRVMHWDAWCSMAVYTAATLAFYVLGAAILHKTGLNPAGTEMIRTLAVMYEPVFGAWAQILFLFGAFAVLYSTFFVANASHARVFSDAIRVFGIIPRAEASYQRSVRVLSGLLPLLCLLVYIRFPKPTMLVLASGVMQAILLPMMSGAALYFRYRRMDVRLAPGRLWDVFLWISALGMLVAGGWLALTKLTEGWLALKTIWARMWLALTKIFPP